MKNKNLIDQQFGDMELKDLTIPMVTEILIDYDRSGSWKNNFITAIRDIYDEGHKSIYLMLL